MNRFSGGASLATGAGGGSGVFAFPAWRKCLSFGHQCFGLAAAHWVCRRAALGCIVCWCCDVAREGLSLNALAQGARRVLRGRLACKAAELRLLHRDGAGGVQRSAGVCVGF